MSSRSSSPSSPEPKGHHRSSGSARKESLSSHERSHSSRKHRLRHSTSPPVSQTCKSRSRSPDVVSHHSKSHGRSRKFSDASSPHSRKHSSSSRRSRSRSKSPASSRRQEHTTHSGPRRSRSRSKTPPPNRRREHSRRSRSRSRSESPSKNRRVPSKKSPSNSPPSHRRRDYSRRSRSRSKSPPHTRRAYHSSSSRRSRSRSPTYSRRSGTQDYKSHRHYGSRRGFSDGYFYKGKETAQYYRARGTPIAKEPSSGDTSNSNAPSFGNKSTTSLPSGPASVPPQVPADSEKLENLTPEQKLERALMAAQALNPKMNTPQPSISTLSATAANAAVNPLLKNPAAAVQKKKLMWNKKSSSGNKWEGVSLGDDGDEEVQAKFRRLMGIKDAPSSQASSQTAATSSDGNMLKEKHEKLRKDLEQQYESSRYMTHLARGSGLGYGTSFSSHDGSS